MVSAPEIVIALTSYPVFLAVLGALMIALLRERRYFVAEVLGLGVAAALITTSILKEIFKVARPEGALIALQSYSYPSGHAVGAFVLAYAAALALSPYVQGRARRYACFGALLIAALLVSLSRIYLGVHRPGEVGAGIFVGLFFIFVCEFIFRVTGERGAAN